jgi:hypothetical protein
MLFIENKKISLRAFDDLHDCFSLDSANDRMAENWSVWVWLNSTSLIVTVGWTGILFEQHSGNVRGIALKS